MPFPGVLRAWEILAEIKRRGVTLVPAGDRLRFHPKRNLTPELVEELRQHKELILKLLKRREIRARDPRPVESVVEVFEIARAQFGQLGSLPPDERPPSKREFGVKPDRARFFAEVRREDNEWRRRGDYPPHIRPVGRKGGAA